MQMLVTAKRHLLGCVELSPRASVECYLEFSGEKACALLRHTLDLTVRDVSFSTLITAEKLSHAIQSLSELQALEIGPDAKIASDLRVPCDSYSRCDFQEEAGGVSYVYAWRSPGTSNMSSLDALLSNSSKPHYYVCFTGNKDGEPEYHFSLIRKEKLRDLQALLENARANLPHLTS